MASLRTHNRRARRMTWAEHVYAPFRAWGPNALERRRRDKRWKALVEASRWGLRPLSEETVIRITAGTMKILAPQNREEFRRLYEGKFVDMHDSPDCLGHAKPLKTQET